MKNAALHVSEPYRKNKIFKNPGMGPNSRSKYIELKKQFFEVGIDLNTFDECYGKSKLDIEIWLDLHTDTIKPINEDSKKYLIGIESPIVCPNNIKAEYHHWFDKVFTWSKNLINFNPNKYVKINYTTHFSKNLNFDLTSPRNGKAAMILGYRMSTVNDSLYDFREKIVSQSLHYTPHKFSLYGHGWEKKFLKGTYQQRLFRYSPNAIQKFISPFLHPLYRGPIKDKFKQLQGYTFNYAIENWTGDEGYVSEKIIDALSCGCIPIYKGELDIEDYFPRNLFVNMDSFSNPTDVIHYVDEIESQHVINIQNDIKDFVASKNFLQYTNSYFATKIVENL